MKKKKSFFLCVFGPDGCGKSSVFNELDRIYGPNKIAHFHWRPGLFPYKSKKNKSLISNFVKPHKTKTKSTLKSFFILIYYFLDFTLGYFFLVKKKEEIIFYERYFYDLIADQKRYGIDVNPILVKILSFLIIKPDLIIILDADSDTIFSRKQELNKVEIEKQRSFYKESVTKFSESLIIDVTDKQVEEVVHIILNKIKKINV